MVERFVEGESVGGSSPSLTTNLDEIEVVRYSG